MSLTARPPYVQSDISEILTRRPAENVATDLESFSRHAGRTTITTDDVLLLARRNQDLHSVIKDFVDRGKAAKARAKAKGKGKERRAR